MAYDPPWKPGRDAAVGAAVFGSRAVRTAGRWALLPARTVAGAPIVKPALGRARQGLAANGRAVQASGRRRVDDLALTEVELAIDRVLAGPVTEAIGRSLADHEVPQRIAAEFLARTDVQELLAEVLESQATADITDRVLASPQFQHAIEDVASSPAVRDAVAAQTRSLVDDVVDEIRGDSRAARRLGAGEAAGVAATRDRIARHGGRTDEVRRPFGPCGRTRARRRARRPGRDHRGRRAVACGVRRRRAPAGMAGRRARRRRVGVRGGRVPGGLLDDERPDAGDAAPAPPRRRAGRRSARPRPLAGPPGGAHHRDRCCCSWDSCPCSSTAAAAACTTCSPRRRSSPPTRRRSAGRRRASLPYSRHAKEVEHEGLDCTSGARGDGGRRRGDGLRRRVRRRRGCRRAARESSGARCDTSALPAPGGTSVAQIDRPAGTVNGFVSLRGSWGIPIVAFDGTTSGVSAGGADARARPELADASPATEPLRAREPGEDAVAARGHPARRVLLRCDLTGRRDDVPDPAHVGVQHPALRRARV